jgi:hypothetical protein
MNLPQLGRIAGILTLTAGLAGCMDITMEVDVLSETTGRATTTSVMGAEAYAMAKSGMSGENSGQDGFCGEQGATLTENEDGSATCVLVAEGAFADLNLDDDENGTSFTVISPGVVRVGFKTEDMTTGLSGGDDSDEETRQMMLTFFEGHAITIRVRGNRIVDTNMTLSADGRSAETVIPFLDLIEGTTGLPDELYATVDTN